MSADTILGLNSAAAAWWEALMHACLQGSLFILVVWAVCRLFSRLPARTRHWLWWLACVKLLLGLVWITPVAIAALPPPAPLLPGTLSPQGRRADGIPSKAAYRTHPPAPVFVSQAVPPDFSLPPPIPPEPSLSWTAWLLLGWLGGIGFCLWLAFRHIVALRRLLRYARPLEDSELRQQAALLARRLRLRGAVRLAESEQACVPMVIGLFRPTIVFPAGFAHTLDGEDQQMVLAHEMAHIRRWDLWLAWPPLVCQSLFGFLPPVWLAVREWTLAREAACDEWALRVTGATPIQYGRLLVHIAAGGRGRRFVSALEATAGYQGLKQRVVWIKQLPSRHSGFLRTVGAAALALALLGLIPWRVIAQAGRAAPPRYYTVTDIAVFPSGDDPSYVSVGLNDAGVVVGTTERPPDNRNRAYSFLWRNGRLSPLDARMDSAFAINNREQVIGGEMTSTGGYLVAWQKGKRTYLAHNANGAYAINESGQVVGTAPMGSNAHAFLWNVDGAGQDLGTLSGYHSSAADINERRQVVGSSEILDTGYKHAFLWQNGRMQDLGVLPGCSWSAATAINDYGQVVGTSEGETRNDGSGASGRIHAVLWQNGKITDLGTPGSGLKDVHPYSINNTGQVVGMAEGPPTTRVVLRAHFPSSSLVRDTISIPTRRAFLYRDGKMEDLNLLIPAQSGWILEQAIRINDAGQIVCIGAFEGQRHLFLLTPKSR